MQAFEALLTPLRSCLRNSSLRRVNPWSWLGACCVQMITAGASAAEGSNLLEASIIQSAAEHLGLAL